MTETPATQRSIIIALTAALALGVVGIIAAVSSFGDGASSASTTTTTTASTLPPPRADQVRFEGTVTDAFFHGLVSEPLNLPLTFEPNEAGRGNGAEFQGVLVDGVAATMVWDGGRPLPIAGDSTLKPDPTAFVMSESALRIRVDALVADLSPGTNQLGATVAVSIGGNATSRTDSSFVVEERGTIVFRGEVSAPLPSQTYDFVGPGSLLLSGDFAVETADGDSTAVAIGLADGGLFELRLEPAPGGGWLASGTAQGTFTLNTD